VPVGTEGRVVVPVLPAGGLGRVSVGGVEKGIVGEDEPVSFEVEGGKGEVVVTRC
jgi:hypothetical protein